ncbi:MAG: sigma-70 family RNA polymerase sigma factor [Clostridia bacterium]|nr:sigma-70 family RNA polymerase sigma factor [Clostridia bacterium]
MEQKEFFTNELISAAASGSLEAVTALYDATYNSVYKTVKSMAKSENLIMDVIQDAYVKAFYNLNMLTDPRTFPAWVRKIAISGVNDRLRKNNPDFIKTGNANGFTDDNGVFSSELTLSPDNNAKLIHRILDALDKPHRFIVGMYYYSGMNTKSIAELTGSSEDAVRFNILSARKTIEACVNQMQSEGINTNGLSPVQFMLFLFGGYSLSTGDIPYKAATFEAVRFGLGLRFFRNNSPQQKNNAPKATNDEASFEEEYTIGPETKQEPQKSNPVPLINPEPKQKNKDVYSGSQNIEFEYEEDSGKSINKAVPILLILLFVLIIAASVIAIVFKPFDLFDSGKSKAENNSSSVSEIKEESSNEKSDTPSQISDDEGEELVIEAAPTPGIAATPDVSAQEKTEENKTEEKKNADSKVESSSESVSVTDVKSDSKAFKIDAETIINDYASAIGGNSTAKELNKNAVSSATTDDDTNIYYSLTDINSDGENELLIGCGSNGHIKITDLYVFSDGKAHKVFNDKEIGFKSGISVLSDGRVYYENNADESNKQAGIWTLSATGANSTDVYIQNSAEYEDELYHKGDDVKSYNDIITMVQNIGTKTEYEWNMIEAKTEEPAEEASSENSGTVPEGTGDEILDPGSIIEYFDNYRNSETYAELYAQPSRSGGYYFTWWYDSSEVTYYGEIEGDNVVMHVTEEATVYVTNYGDYLYVSANDNFIENYGDGILGRFYM